MQPAPARERVLFWLSEVEMLRKDKEAVIAETVRLLSESKTLYVSDYRGLTVTEITDLRGELRQQGAFVKVLKNTLTRRAAGEAQREEIVPLLSGPVAITFCGDDPVGPARALVDFARTHPMLEVRGGFMQGLLLDSANVKSLSQLPSRDALVAQVVGTLAAPISGLLTVLQGTVSGLVRALQQVADQRAAAGRVP
jgi:large subunit ribosomal protein L10